MSWFKSKRIFLDYAAATPVLPEVRQAMEKYWSNDFYNPSAIYREGLEVKKEIENCCARVARALGVQPKGIIFTAGGTDSDNLAILGAFEAFRQAQDKRTQDNKPHIIISAIEHPAIVAAAEEVVRRGGEVSTCEVDEEGLISIKTLEKLLKKNTFLISVGLANNEIGTIQPIAKIGRMVRKYRKEQESAYPYLHTDASQVPSFLNISLETLQADLLTLDGSKIYGPKSIGILATKAGVGLHHKRAGTPNPALIIGLTLALEIALRNRERESKRLEVLREYFIKSVTKCLPNAIINNSPENHLPNIISVSLPGTLSEFILLKLDQAGVMVSVGSACSYDERVSGSPVIIALGKKYLAESTLRFSFGRPTIESDVRRAIEIFCSIAQSVIK